MSSTWDNWCVHWRGLYKHGTCEAGIDPVRWATNDLGAIRQSELFIQLAGDSGRAISGGKHVELGAALTLEPGPVINLIGQPENIFQYLPEVTRFDSVMDYKNHVLANIKEQP